MIADAFDAIVVRYGAGDAEPEVVRAREEYYERTGRVFEEDDIFEARAVAFLEWYALDRKQGSPPRTPAEHFLEELIAAPDTNLLPMARALCTTHRGLFEVLAIDHEHVLVDDLAAGARWRVHERRRLPGVAPGDLFEGRLVGVDDQVLFLRGFLFHPREAVPVIRELAVQARRDGVPPAELCDRLLRLRVQCERYRHVPVARIYDGTAQTGSVVAKR